MERIVYLLGAGFSAPLGLPVMSNFYFKSQDMFLTDPEKYGHFKDVFDTIRDMSIIKNYYDANLFNIEEILSVRFYLCE
jgi:NAD-dependent SIR2 family protein deacetylase